MAPQVIILGAGISGLSMAWRLSHYGIHAHVFESTGIVGGLSGTYRENGYCIDIGPHSFFSDDSEILKIVLGLFDKSLTPQKRNVKFYYQGKYLDYPLKPYSILFQMGILNGILAASSFLKSHLSSLIYKAEPVEEESVKDWATRSFGSHLYHTFFKPYTEQFWKIPCTELSSRTIPTNTRMSFINTCRFLFLQKQLTKSKSSLVEREALPTYYPETGFGEIAEKIASAAEKSGAKIHLGCRVVRLEKSAANEITVHYESNSKPETTKCSHVVSTIPVGQFVNMIHPPAPTEVLHAANRLSNRSLIVLGMVTEKQKVLNCSYIYVLNRPYNRITETNEFGEKTSPPGKNIIAVEIPCLLNDNIWNSSKEELYAKCINYLSKDGFLNSMDVKRLIMIKTPNAYPIYYKDYSANLKLILDYLNIQKNLTTLGRSGEFRYMDADQCIRRSFDYAEYLAVQLQSAPTKA